MGSSHPTIPNDTTNCVCRLKNIFANHVLQKILTERHSYWVAQIPISEGRSCLNFRELCPFDLGKSCRSHGFQADEAVTKQAGGSEHYGEIEISSMFFCLQAIFFVIWEVLGSFYLI